MLFYKYFSLYASFKFKKLDKNKRNVECLHVSFNANTHMITFNTTMWNINHTIETLNYLNEFKTEKSLQFTVGSDWWQIFTTLYNNMSKIRVWVSQEIICPQLHRYRWLHVSPKWRTHEIVGILLHTFFNRSTKR